MRTAVDCRSTRLIVRHDDFNRRGADVAGSVGDFESNGVNTAVTIAFALGSQLNGRAVRCDDDVMRVIAIAITVLYLVAGYLRDNHAADSQTRIATIGNASHKISY